jgi:hypothetical protein
MKSHCCELVFRLRLFCWVTDPFSWLEIEGHPPVGRTGLERARDVRRSLTRNPLDAKLAGELESLGSKALGVMLLDPHLLRPLLPPSAPPLETKIRSLDDQLTAS